jgi:DNA-binding transcriptional LysR family regulator
MLTETSIKCFLSLAQTLNFTQTAKELFMTQQSVSQHIAKLETHLGFPLFLRSRHFVALTQAGRNYYAFFSDVSVSYQKMYEDCLTHYASALQSLNVGYQNWTYLGPAAHQAINDLWKQCPGLEVEITRRSPGLLVHKLKQHELQLIVLYGRWAPKAERVQVVKLMDLELVLLVSPDNPLATDDATWKDFLREPFLIDTFEHESPADTNRRVRQELKLLGAAPSRVVVLPDREASYTAAEMGQGFVLSTNINRVAQGGHLRTYPTGIHESLICAWYMDEENEIVGRYAHCLQNAYRAVAREAALSPVQA